MKMRYGNWNVIRYYNKLSYLKDKTKYENGGK